MTASDRASLKARNLELFKRCTPEPVFRRLTGVKPRWRLATDDAGTPVLLDGERPVMGPDADAPAGAVRPGSVFRFTARAPERHWIDQHVFRFLEATLRRAAADGIVFFDSPATTDAYFMVVFGIGLGRHLPPLAEMTRCRHVIIVEPDIEFLWHSMETFDWIGFVGGVQAKGGDVDFILTDDANEVAGNIWRTLRRTNPCAADGFFCCVHHHGALVGRVIEDLRNDVGLITSELGYFYDETIMFRNNYENFSKPRARLFSSSPEAKRGLPAFVVGSGPSLDASLGVIKENFDNAVVISCGSALRPLVLNGIRPDFHIELENANVSPMVAQVADEHDLSSLCVVAASTADPEGLDPFGDVVFYFRYSLSSYPLFCDSDDAILRLGGPTVTNAGLSFAQQTGFRDIYLFGVDLGARAPDRHHAEDTYHDTQDAIDLREKVPFIKDLMRFDIPTAANFGGECLTTRPFYAARKVLAGAIGQYRDGRRHFNFSDGVAIDGAEPLRPEALALTGPAVAKENTVRDVIAGFPALTEPGDGRRWPGDVMAAAIGAHIGALTGVLGGIVDFKDKSYLTRLTAILRPQLGYVDPPPRGAGHGRQLPVPRIVSRDVDLLRALPDPGRRQGADQPVRRDQPRGADPEPRGAQGGGPGAARRGGAGASGAFHQVVRRRRPAAPDPCQDSAQQSVPVRLGEQVQALPRHRRLTGGA